MSIAPADLRETPPPSQGNHKPDAARLISVTAGILGNIQSVVGDGAAQALFRYSAFEEGKRIARDAGAKQLEQALQAFDRLFGHDSTATKSAHGAIEVNLHGSMLIHQDQRVLDLLIVGLYEGLLHAVYQTRYKGRILGRQPSGDAVLTFEPDHSDR